MEETQIPSEQLEGLPEFEEPLFDWLFSDQDTDGLAVPR
jgi:hypothetical protein